jgi:hypothetical protein
VTQVFHDGQLYSAWLAPLAAAFIGALLCLAGGVVSALQAERGGRSWMLAFALAPLGSMLLLALGWGAALASWTYGRSLTSELATGPLPWRVFHELMGWELAAWLAAAGIAGLAVLVRGLLGGPWRPEEHALPGALLGLGLILALCGPIHASALLALGPLPRLEGPDQQRVHTGRSLQIEPTVVGAARAGSCRTEPLRFEPREAGEHSLALRAHCGLLAVEREVVMLVGEDRGPAQLPLAPGNSWTWRRFREWHNHMLWFFPEHGQDEGPDLHLRVASNTEGPYLNSWQLVEEIEGGEPVAHELYRWDGQLLEMLDGAPTERAFFALLEPAEGEEPIHPAQGEEPAWQACSIGVFPHSDCRCLLEPHGHATLPGPSFCEPRHGAGDDLRAIGSALLAVITVGLVIVDPDDDPRWVLQRSSTLSNQP